MHAPALVRKARAAGLVLTREGDELVIRGPKSAEPVARRLLDRKAEVLVVLAEETAADHAEDWCAFLEERAAFREYEGGYSRREAERLAWDELECRWHRVCGDRVSRDQCAGCLRPIDAVEALDLDDGCRVHLACVTRYGKRWRETAAEGLATLGLRPPQ
jgi:hypothetical protein